MQDEQSDDELIAQARNGVPEAFEWLVRRHQDFIVNFIYRMAGDRDTALDIAQESFVKAYKSLHSFQQKSSFKTWLTSIALNLSRTYLRKRQGQTTLTENVVEDFSSTPEEELHAKRRKEKVRLALKQLKPELQEVIHLCAIEGFAYSEASEALRIPLGTVCSRMNTALAELRTILSKEASNG